MPALTSEVANIADRNSEFAAVAGMEIRKFRDLADSFADEEVLGLARIARAALVDRKTTFPDRQDSIRYLALNSSVRLEDLWAEDDSLWVTARNLSGIAFSPRPIQRFAGLVIELWRAGSNPVGSL
jgi:hypothetical protein